MTLFSRVATAASLWVHIIAINLFAAREMFLDGEKKPNRTITRGLSTIILSLFYFYVYSYDMASDSSLLKFFLFRT